MIRRLLILACVLVVAAPADAIAHATLQATSPAEGAVVAIQPASVVFTFDEPVQGTDAAIRVLDGRGVRVDAGRAYHPQGRQQRFAVDLRPRLAAGSYTAAYRVVSADGHIVSGGFVFSIGHPSATTVPLANLAGGAGGSGGGYPMSAARAVQFAAIGIAAGLLLFTLICWQPAIRRLRVSGVEIAPTAARFGRRSRLLLAGAAVAGLAASVVGVVLEAADEASTSFVGALAPSTLRHVFATRFGETWTAAGAAWLIVGVAAWLIVGRDRIPSRLREASLLVLAPPLLYLLFLPSISGHGATQKPVIVLFPTTVAHVVAMSAWFGGLVALVAAAPVAYRVLDDQPRRLLAGGVLGRFSVVALTSVVVLVASGLVQSWIEIRHPSRLLTTDFGRATAIKIVLLLALVGLGALNRQRTLPRLRQVGLPSGTDRPRGAGAGAGAERILRRTLRGEVALIVAVLAVTGALTGYRPATAADTGPISRTATAGGIRFSILVAPATVGQNQIELSLTDTRTGRPFTATRQLEISASLPSLSLGPLPLGAAPVGPGLYTATGAYLNAPGNWTLTISDRTSDFDETTTTISLPIRR